jgi:hypothetical protein
MPSSFITLYSCLVITESYAALKSINKKCISVLLSCVFSRICRVMNRASVVDLPGQKPY